MSRVTNKSKASDLFIHADKCEERGELRKAFRFMLAAAKLGDKGAQVNVGNYYDDAKGVRRNRAAALYWYKRAYKRGVACAASNIGVLLRNEKQLRRALTWFFRAVKLGDDEAHLDIGKHYLHNEDNPRKAIPYFERVAQSDRVTEAGAEEATRLLANTKKTLKAVSRRSSR